VAGLHRTATLFAGAQHDPYNLRSGLQYLSWDGAWGGLGVWRKNNRKLALLFHGGHGVICVHLLEVAAQCLEGITLFIDFVGRPDSEAA
jgi:hypothetical protein